MDDDAEDDGGRDGGDPDGAGADGVDAYRRRARHYDLTSRLAPIPGYPQRAHRARAVTALRLRPGACVVELACGTGVNFPLVRSQLGPGGHLIGVDVSAAMLAQAERRVAANGWRNVRLVHTDAAAFDFPAGVDGILATYPHALLPDPAGVITRAAAALAAGGRCAVLDVKIPAATPAWLLRLGAATVARSTSLREWDRRRPWDVVRRTMQTELAGTTWTELFLGVAYLATGIRRPDVTSRSTASGSTPGVRGRA